MSTRKTRGWLILLTLSLCGPRSVPAATVSPLYSRGYTVLPAPQKVVLGQRDFQFSDEWRLELGSQIQATDVAVETLKEDLQSRFGIALGAGSRPGGAARTLHMAIVPGSVSIGQAMDRDKEAIARQAYKISLASDNVIITANAATGLFYGVQTFLQLLTLRQGSLWLPEGEIIDWPDLQLRAILWDDAFHLERLEVLKAAVRQAASYKVNGFTLKLDGHFQYQSAAPVVEPYALSPADYQELTDYALRYYVQVIPYLDAPAHDAFILKHPEYAALRAFPESNYEFCTTNPETYKLFSAMFQDLLNANRGGKYILLSTDEPYYVGMAKNSQCNEVDRAKELGSVGKLLAEFVTKVGDGLHAQGRTVIFWGEYPMKPDDIPSLPSYLVNGEVYGPNYDPAFKAQGIKQMIYTSAGGAEPLFPTYYPLLFTERLHPPHGVGGNVSHMFEHISFTSARQQTDLMGAVVAGWRDAGVHPETFWLGYTTGLAAAWHPGSPDPQELMSSFYPLFYGPSAANMGRVYQLMSEQAQFWEDGWETTASSARKPLFGDPYSIFKPPRPAHDQTLPLPPVPSPQLLRVGSDWSQENARRLQLAATFLAENDELMDLLHMNLHRVEFNRYNLEVFLSVARLYRQNLEMLLDLGRINELLKSAQEGAAAGQAARALTAIDMALDIAEEIWQQRNTVLQDATSTWYETWLPRVAEASGRRHLSTLDDAKDSPPDRTIDMSYLVLRELLFSLGEWAEQVRVARNLYAQANHLPARDHRFDWNDTKTLVPIEGAISEEEEEFHWYW